MRYNIVIRVDNPEKGVLDMHDSMEARSFHDVYEVIKKLSIYPFELFFKEYNFEVDGFRVESYSDAVELAELKGLTKDDIKAIRRIQVMLN